MAFELVRYSQRDPKWRDKKLGNSTLSLGHSGCAVTSIAMLLSGHGYQESPDSLNEKLKKSGGFMGAAIVWSAVSNLYPRAGFKNMIICRDSDAPIDAIGDSIRDGQPVLLEVDYSPQAGLQTHWVVAYQKAGKDFIILDPYPHPTEDDKDVSLMQRFAHGKELKRAITAVIWYDVQPASYTPQPPQPLEPGVFYIQVVGGLAHPGLRLRSQPTTASETLGYQASGTILRVLESETVARPKIGIFNQWIHVRDPEGREGYVAAWYMESGPLVLPLPEEPPAEEPTPPSPLVPSTVSRVKASVGDGLEDVPLAPPIASHLTPQQSTNSPTHRLAANIWNRYGGLLEALSSALNIEPAVAVAILAVESGGQAFGADGRMIIRFENHIFYNQWGKNNQAKFSQHFNYNSSQSWTGHKWRSNPNQDWQPTNLPDFHGNQSREWEVFNFAASLDDTGAKMSISMGAPQIMGFNFGLIGFASVQDMFNAFSAGERDQVIGFFDFVRYVSPNALKALQAHDFKTFAAYYNGSGQAVMYGNLIQTSYDAFNQLRTAQPLPPEPPQPEPPQPEPPQPEPTPPSPPPPVPENIFVLVSSSVGSSGLRMRRLPSMAGALIVVQPAATRLEVLDEPGLASPKIGQNGAWLKVRDSKGREGYVAAWLVELEKKESDSQEDAASDNQPEPTPSTPAEPTLPPAPPQLQENELVFVKVSSQVGASGLRMRRQPSTAGALVVVQPAATRLRVLDEPALAKSRIGQNGSWLWVRDLKNREGYVAAWFVELDETKAESPVANPAENIAFDISDFVDIEPEPLVVYVSGLARPGGLRLRQEPNGQAAIIKTIPAESPLTVLDDSSIAESHIGKFDMWLKVREPLGDEGYVAAWFLTR